MVSNAQVNTWKKKISSLVETRRLICLKKTQDCFLDDLV